MLEQLSVFWTVVMEPLFVLQTFASALAGTIVLGEPCLRKTRTYRILRRLLHTLLLLVLILILEALFFAMSSLHTHLQYLRGLSFSFPILIAYIVYAAFFSHFRSHEKITLVIFLFSTVIVMMEWSAPYGIAYLFSGKGAEAALECTADVLIILFALLLRRFSVTKYYFTKVDAVLSCTEAGLVGFAAMVHEGMPDVLGVEINNSVRIYTFTIFMMLYVINLLTYLFSYQMSRNRQMLMESQLIEQKQSAELEMAQLTAESIQELREIRHDIKNQYFYMKSMLDRKQYEELNDFFEKFTGKISSQLFRYIDCGNQDISAAINLERLKAERDHIPMNVNAAVPERLQVESMDLCSLLTNLIDNGLEECHRTKGEKYVHIVIQTQGKNSLYICVINPTDRQPAADVRTWATSKRNKERHGFGVSIIQRIAEKYDGYFHGCIKDGTFIAEVILNEAVAEEDHSRER